MSEVVVDLIVPVERAPIGGLSDVRSATDHDDGLHGVEMNAAGSLAPRRPSEARTDTLSPRRCARRLPFAHRAERCAPCGSSCGPRRGRRLRPIAAWTSGGAGQCPRRLRSSPIKVGDWSRRRADGLNKVVHNCVEPVTPSRKLLPGAEDAVRSSTRSAAFDAKGLVQHFVLGEDRWKPPLLNAHGQAPAVSRRPDLKPRPIGGFKESGR